MKSLLPLTLLAGTLVGLSVVAGLPVGVHIAALIAFAVSIDVSALTVTQFTGPENTERPLRWAVRHAMWHGTLLFVGLGGLGLLSAQLSYLLGGWDKSIAVVEHIKLLENRFPDWNVREWLKENLPGLPAMILSWLALFLWAGLYWGRLRQAAKDHGAESRQSMLSAIPGLLRFVGSSYPHLCAAYVSIDMWFLAPLIRSQFFEGSSAGSEANLAGTGALALAVVGFVAFYGGVVALIVTRLLGPSGRARTVIRCGLVYLEPLLTGYFAAGVLFSVTSYAENVWGWRIVGSIGILLGLMLLLRNHKQVWAASHGAGIVFDATEQEDIGLVRSVLRSLRRLGDGLKSGLSVLFLGTMDPKPVYDVVRVFVYGTGVYFVGLRVLGYGTTVAHELAGWVLLVIGLAFMSAASSRAIRKWNERLGIGNAGLLFLVPACFMLVLLVLEGLLFVIYEEVL